MDICKSYFNYVVETRCGIPVVYVDGTKTDWEKIKTAVNYLLPKFDLSDWMLKLNTILDKIINTFDGNIDVEFFKNIYKYRSMSGGDEVTGWINDLFPYIVEPVEYGSKRTWNIVKKNETILKLETCNFPSSISSVPFVWEYLGIPYNMNFFAGFCGFNETYEGAVRARKNFFIAYEK